MRITNDAGHAAGTLKLPGKPVDTSASLDGAQFASRAADIEELAEGTCVVTISVTFTTRTVVPMPIFTPPT
jgi:hypothetical protein